MSLGAGSSSFQGEKAAGKVCTAQAERIGKLRGKEKRQVRGDDLPSTEHRPVYQGTERLHNKDGAVSILVPVIRWNTAKLSRHRKQTILML